MHWSSVILNIPSSLLSYCLCTCPLLRLAIFLQTFMQLGFPHLSGFCLSGTSLKMLFLTILARVAPCLSLASSYSLYFNTALVFCISVLSVCLSNIYYSPFFNNRMHALLVSGPYLSCSLTVLWLKPNKCHLNAWMNGLPLMKAGKLESHFYYKLRLADSIMLYNFTVLYLIWMCWVLEFGVKYLKSRGNI